MPFFLYIETFAGSREVLENFSWGSWKSPGFFFVCKRVGTLYFGGCRNQTERQVSQENIEIVDTDKNNLHPVKTQ